VLDAARWNVVSYSPGDDLAETWSLFDGTPARASR
jgi:hypothetical protein